MENLYICHVKENYINFLRDADHRVLFNKNQTRPYVGVVLAFGAYHYFVPMESPKPNHKNLKNGKHLLKINGGSLGLLGFNNMVPVPVSAIIRYDISSEPDAKYRNLLMNQIEWCNRNKASVFDHAFRTYQDVVNRRSDFLSRISCDFRKLETACLKYENETCLIEIKS